MLGNIKEEQATIDAPIGRHKTQRKKMAVVDGGREARTHFRVIYRFGNATLVSCRLETAGRIKFAFIWHTLAILFSTTLSMALNLQNTRRGSCFMRPALLLCIQEQQSAYVFMRLWMNIFQNNSKVGKLTQKHYTKIILAI